MSAAERAPGAAPPHRAGLARRVWAWLRRLTGDDAYERYRAHQLRCHREAPVLDRRAFYADEQRRKWSGVSRCC